MWQHECRIILWASMACYRDSFTFFVPFYHGSGRSCYVCPLSSSIVLTWLFPDPPHYDRTFNAFPVLHVFDICSDSSGTQPLCVIRVIYDGQSKSSWNSPADGECEISAGIVAVGSSACLLAGATCLDRFRRAVSLLFRLS
jgi:hypothetical protein